MVDKEIAFYQFIHSAIYSFFVGENVNFLK